MTSPPKCSPPCLLQALQQCCNKRSFTAQHVVTTRRATCVLWVIAVFPSEPSLILRPLEVACRAGRVEVVDELIRLGAPVEGGRVWLGTTLGFGPATLTDTPLMHAAMFGRIPVMQLLVEAHGANVNTVTQHGDTALRHALHHRQAMEWLVAHGASLDAIRC